MSASIYVSEKLNRELVKIAEDVAYKAVSYCAEKYNFNAEEVYRELGLGEIKVERSKKLKVEKVKMSSPKVNFPLPYNGELKDECCFALRQNNGLYTQCQGIRNGSSDFCKGCANQMQKTGAEVPEYGTIQMRKAVGIFDYTDPKGRKPIAYAKIMKKYKLTEEQVLEEGRKLNIVINPEHFVVPEETKRGRPSKEKEPKEKGSRGRPKKSKKVLEIDGDTEDLFATLVANANEVEDVKSEEEVVITKNEVSKAEKEQAKLEKKEAERLAREAKKKAEEEEKATKKAAEKAAKEAEKAAKEAEKAAKEAAKEAAKKEKEEKLAAKEAKEATKKEKASKKESPTKEAAVEEDDEPDVVKKIEFEGKKYLKSKKTGIIYDYNEYTKNGEQVVVGKWNDASNKIVFNASEEEDEEEYEN